MHAIHLSPHTIQVSERVGLILFGMVSVVTLAAVGFAAVGWYLWAFS
jgi:hypothetical protein